MCYSKCKGVASIKTGVHFLICLYCQLEKGVMFREIFYSGKGFHRGKSSKRSALVHCQLIFGISSSDACMNRCLHSRYFCICTRIPTNDTRIFTKILSDTNEPTWQYGFIQFNVNFKADINLHIFHYVSGMNLNIGYR